MGEEVSSGEGGVGRYGLNEGVRDERPDEFSLIAPGCVGEPVPNAGTDIRVPDREGEVSDVREGTAVSEARERVKSVDVSA